MQLRRSPQKAAALESLARRLGRSLVNRGKHPMWENTEFGDLYPLSIPSHGSKDLPIGTKNSVLDQLEENDIAAWEQRMIEESDETDDTGNGRMQ